MPEMNPAVAGIYAHLTSVPRLRNLWVAQGNQKIARLGHDLMIASIAIAHGMPILTDNITDFMSVHDHVALPGVYHPMNSRWYVRPQVPITLPEFDGGEMDPHEALLPFM